MTLPNEPRGMRPPIAELVNQLFLGHPRPDGRLYSNAEVVRASNGIISSSTLSKLRHGIIPNPGRNVLLCLCEFFEVSPTYFFPELGLATLDHAPDAPSTLPHSVLTTGPDALIGAKIRELLLLLQGQTPPSNP